MRNSIIGKIIIENESVNDLRRQIQLAEPQLKKSKTPEEVQEVQQGIASLKIKLKEKSGLVDKKRSELIKGIEKLTGRPLLTYFSINGSIVDRDARIIEDFLLNNDIKKFDILIDSPGGLTDAAEKMIKICRMRTGSDQVFDFRTIVINQAKSATTLFALGSRKILLCKSAELGPVDPQIIVFAPNGERIRDSAHQLYYGFKKYYDEAKSKPCEADLLLLSKYDPIAIKRANVAIDHTNDIIKKRIYTNPYLKKDYSDTKSLKKDLKIFVDHETSYSHGRPIYYEDINSKGFCKNKFIQKFDEFFVSTENKKSSEVTAVEKKIWELAIRSLEVVRPNTEPIINGEGKIVGFNKIALKLFESSNGLILTKEIIN